ncbi:unnamed protein product, partial [Iphiclides podalirius]
MFGSDVRTERVVFALSACQKLDRFSIVRHCQKARHFVAIFFRTRTAAMRTNSPAYLKLWRDIFVGLSGLASRSHVRMLGRTRARRLLADYWRTAILAYGQRPTHPH